MEGGNDAGATRPDRLETLRRNFVEHGIDAQIEIVPGVLHDAARVVPRVQTFFARVLRRLRAAEGGTTTLSAEQKTLATHASASSRARPANQS